MTDQQRTKILFPHTQTEAYVVQLDIEKKSSTSHEKKTIFIESPFDLVKRVGLLASMLAFNAYSPEMNFEGVVKGLNKGDVAKFIDYTKTVYQVTEHEYLLDEYKIQQAKKSGQYFSFGDILNPLYTMLVRDGAVSHIYTSAFLNFRNADEEFAALIGTVNELVVLGESKYQEAHNYRIFLAINSVPLMGYPSKPMIARA